MTIQVFEPGTPVIIGACIEAVVNQVLIESDNCISYKCSWFDDNVRYEQWFRTFDVKPNPRQERLPLKIGFSN